MTSGPTTVAEWVGRILAGERRALAALIRDLDDDRPGAREVLGALQALRAGAAPAAQATAEGASATAEGASHRTDETASNSGTIVGITGGAGAGKSSLVDALIAHWRAAGARVGVVAIDPSSPLRGGAILGDRIRMQRHATDDGVFIRSMASRGALGGLSRAAMDAAAVLAAGGFGRVVVETVGAGQAEVDIAAAADVTVVVMTPGLGDDVQMLKAGVLEVADVLVLNKSDRPGADATLRDLQAMLSLRQATAATGKSEGVVPLVPIIETVATTGAGVAALASAIDDVRASSSSSVTQRRWRRAEARIRGIVVARLEAATRRALATGGASASLVDDVAALRIAAEAAADALMARLRAGY